jgi:NAD(P)-dependent dehydrogenase (short-subunit alcohol dehydrogenase family)
MSRQPRPLQGRVVAITGGTRGIGRATAAALAREGARVGLAGTDRQRAEQAGAEIGGETRGYAVDVRDRGSFGDFLDAVERDLGPLDVLINNAGIMPVGPFVDETDEMAALQVDTNLHGMINGSKEALARMLPRRSGHVVNLSSITGRGGFPHIATYCATKFAIYGLTDALRIEFTGTGVDFTCVLPALVDTEMSSGVRPGFGIKKSSPDEVAEAILDGLRRPRFAVYVPRMMGPLIKLNAIVPDRPRDAIGRLFEADKVMLSADRASRSAYESRIAGGAGEERELPAEEQLDRVDPDVVEASQASE